MPFINDMLAKSSMTGDGDLLTPKAKRPSRFLFDPLAVMNTLRQHIIGQDDMKAAVDDMLHLVKADLSARDQPLSVMLFLGPTGVGKTETVKVLAQAIHGQADHFCRIDMNTLAQQHYAAALSGAPPGYVGSKEGYTLFNRETVEGSFSRPGIVLFDEIEKADRDVVRTLLNILDNGKISLAGGQGEINFRNSLVFMTSNIGARQIQVSKERGISGFFSRKSDKAIILAALQKHFEPEFINRIHCTLVFEGFDPARLDRLLDLELKKMSQKLACRQVAVDLAIEVREALKASFDQRYGARGIVRQFRQWVEIPLARALINYPDKNEFVIRLHRHRAVANPK
jgi:ATP-dependent Clp protease ATP-binding subunit ClpA